MRGPKRPILGLELIRSLADEALEVGNWRVVRQRIESVTGAVEAIQVERRPGFQRDPRHLRCADKRRRYREVDQWTEDRRDIGSLVTARFDETQHALIAQHLQALPHLGVDEAVVREVMLELIVVGKHVTKRKLPWQRLDDIANGFLPSKGLRHLLSLQPAAAISRAPRSAVFSNHASFSSQTAGMALRPHNASACDATE
jgi:hypothetical protein